MKLDNQLWFSLYATSREVIKLYKPVLDKYNITYTQYATMLVFWEKGKITVKQIGEEEGFQNFIKADPTQRT
ncbi:transcriptional regulator, SarA/Rot family [Clostridium bowmanii]|uniref:transcriptional regulator, SarA/Rot family n=1 Tax=Clostridium bowmanii TaxID=132925 RepID=UPI0035E46249